jgi:hypothetical protein
MTTDDFNEWLTYHGSRFLGLATWLAKATGKEGIPSKQDVLRAWAYTLRDLTLHDAQAASDELYALPDDQLPKGFDRHPIAVRDLAKAHKRRFSAPRQGPQRVDGEDTYACLICRDTGVVIVVDPKTVCEIQAGRGADMVAEPAKYPFYTAAVGCTCRATIPSQWRGMIYEPGRFFATSDDWGCLSADEEVRAVERWLETRRPANYVEAFDQ